ncbi:MAG: 2-amino-4-hydroxy-6-hydroxymethyldihydropteridine diphosphokinase [Muribaculaceae bacterium]|nr:2-amino-4-hydroxy-6-hydroxymethyldihydropteridine diphosphokinase [Muribaculaceae bacterium]MDE7190462.1 2-amino-4-hydroxy-6-hydroxymethyldihydropteridine diphosphokinase [Muribaculaceae bacterium]
MNTKGYKVTLSLGSNCGDRRTMLSHAIEWLEGRLGAMETSDFYETSALADKEGRCTHPTYMNAVVRGIYYGDGAAALQTEAKQYEEAVGRDAEARLRGCVPIDIDVVISDGIVLRERDAASRFFTIGLEQLDSELGI